MTTRDYLYIAYGIFLLILLVINLLYIFQVFRYRLRGDISMLALFIHLLLVTGVLIAGAIW